MNTIEKGNVQIKFIEDELKELDRKKIFYEDKIEEIKKQVEHYRNNLIDFNKMKENLSFIGESIDAFEPKLKKNILRLFIEQVMYYKEKIRISLRDLTSTGLSFSADSNPWFDKIQQWLPNWIIDRTFTCVFFFEPKPPKEGKSPHYYRNPICLAKDYKRMIDSEDVKNQSDLARKLGVSRVRISQVLSLLKLDVKIIEAVEKLGDPMPKRYISERKLRSLIKLTNERQRATFQSIIPLKKISCTTVR